jgi:hypothetical protein
MAKNSRKRFLKDPKKEKCGPVKSSAIHGGGEGKGQSSSSIIGGGGGGGEANGMRLMDGREPRIFTEKMT